MPENDQYEELQKRIAGLAERVYALEVRAGLRASQPGLSVKRRREATAENPAVSSSLESRIGGHWLNRVGIIAVLLGVSYFLRYAFENRWIAAEGRVVIGLVAGLAVVFWSEHIRRQGQIIFSHSLKAVGIGVLYLSLWASSQLYQLAPIGLAFAAMSVVTAATVALALWQDSLVVAGFALVGAFITPLVLSTGENNATSLFSYVAILNAGALVLLRFRPWNRLLVGSFVGTLILYSGWHARYYTVDQFWIAFGFATLFFTAFAVVPWVARSERDSTPVLLVAPANAAVYFVEVYELFSHVGKHIAAAWAAVVLGCLYFLIGLFLSTGPEVTSSLHWAIGAGLLVIATPVGLEGHWITIGWFFEAGALVWVGHRTLTRSLKYVGAVALALGVARLMAFDNFTVSRIVFNHRMLTFAVAIAVLASIARVVARSAVGQDRRALPILIVSINLLALHALNQEIGSAYQQQAARDFAYSAMWMVYGAGLMIAGFWWKSQFVRWQALILIAITVGKVFIYDTASLDIGYRILSFIALGLLLLATSYSYEKKRSPG
ncbi:MAG TPA: DUF2339 domain-containing protein [Terriglobia bacterium]|nr:DUF2339 domain-containing protein [Terriglobia bacterium]